MANKDLYSVEQILSVPFEETGKYLKHNSELLNLGPVQRRRYVEAFAVIRNCGTSDHYADAKASALQTIWKYENKLRK